MLRQTSEINSEIVKEITFKPGLAVEPCPFQVNDNQAINT
jgi:hypothetical protein